MNVEQFMYYCTAKKGVEETFPFDEQTLVFKVMGKMFALTGLEREVFEVNLKCNPEYSIELRERYHQIYPGYHMSKKHWNTVKCEDGLSDSLIKELIDHSYELVVQNLKKSDRILLDQL